MFVVPQDLVFSHFGFRYRLAETKAGGEKGKDASWRVHRF